MRLVLVLILLLIRTDCWGFSPDVYMRAAAATGIPVELLLAISHVESGFQPHALNVSGRSFFPSSHLRSTWGYSNDRATMSISASCRSIGDYWGNRFGLSKSELLDPQLNVVVWREDSRTLHSRQWKLVEGCRSLPFSRKPSATGLH